MRQAKKQEQTEMLTKLEELILLSVLKLGENAYGTTLYKYIKEVTGKKLSLGGVYFPLDRLTKRGYLTSFTGKATPERRGLSKRYYRLTQKGIAALNEIHRVNRVLWADYSDLIQRFSN
jgi:DNA-binding PadR family transcriptional regulator